MTTRIMRRASFAALIMLMLVFGLMGCAPSSNPAAVVEEYYKALVAKDHGRFVDLICADWESDALLEFDSFGAVEAELDGVSCEQNGTDGEYTVVTCKGGISVTYRGEDNRLLSLDENTYRVIKEGGEWRMCGYQ
jgi:hypothetical protein